jgi:tetratricopeptide (TPR) repeat protein
MRLAPGTVVSRYEIVRFLGAGGMGEVYLAEDRELGRIVALKRVSEDVAGSTAERAHLRDEARAAARLNHPNIAALYDAFEQNGQLWLVIEYVEGENLSARTRRGPATVEEIVSAGVQLADAVAHAHARGIVHRDVKPANIQLTADGRIKILDFGVAKLRPAPTGGAAEVLANTGTARIVGTPQYMAPEGFAGRADERSDLYSLGVVLFELATGHPPFAGDDVEQLWRKVTSADAPSLVSVRPDLPARVCELIGRMMSRDRTVRPAADAVRAGFEGVRAALALQQTVPSGSVSATPHRTLSRWWGLAAAFILAVAGGAMWLLSGSPAAPSTQRLAVLTVDAIAPAGGSTEQVAAALERYLTIVPGIQLVERDRRQTVASPVPTGTAGRISERDAVQHAATALDLDIAAAVRLEEKEDHLQVRSTLWDGSGSRSLGNFERPLTEQRGARDVAYQLAQSIVASLRDRGLIPVSAPEALGPTQAVLDDYLRGLDFVEQRNEPLNVDRALQSFTSALERDPGFAPAHAGRATALLLKYAETPQTSYLEEAKQAVARARAIDPNHPAVHVAHARLLRHTVGETEAITTLRHHLKIHGDDDEGHRLLGTILLERGETEEAIEHLHHGAQAQPSDWRNHSELGYAYMAAGRYTDAVSQYSRVIELTPTSSWGYQMRGTAHQLNNCDALALADYEEALKRTPDAYAYSNKGTIHYSAGEYAEAARAYEKAAQMSSDKPEVHWNLGDAYARLDRVDDARRAWSEGKRLVQRQLDTNANTAYSEAMLGLLEGKLGNREAAIASAERAAASAPLNGEVLYLAAVAHALAGRSERACQFAKQALAHQAEPNVVCQDEDLRNLSGCTACAGFSIERGEGCV